VSPPVDAPTMAGFISQDSVAAAVTEIVKTAEDTST
jgi:hypothetical protein